MTVQLSLNAYSTCPNTDQLRESTLPYVDIFCVSLVPPRISAPATDWNVSQTMLEETGLPYEAHLVRFDAGEQKSPEFLALNPYGKIPAIIDPNGPGGKPLALFESGAILIYLAEKSCRFLAPGSAARYETLQWLMFQMAGIGPMFGQVGFFHKFAGKDYEDKRPRDRYVTEAKRLLEVLDGRLAGRRWIMILAACPLTTPASVNTPTTAASTAKIVARMIAVRRLNRESCARVTSSEPGMRPDGSSFRTGSRTFVSRVYSALTTRIVFRALAGMSAPS